MKKMRLISLFALASVISVPVFAANGIEGKIGLGSVKAASNKAGFDAGLAYALRLEKFFAIVPEINFNWISYDNSLGGAGATGLTGATASTPSTNFYTIPILVNGRLYIPMGADETPVFQPYVTVGAGYGYSSFSTTGGGVNASGSLGGFMYQFGIGGALNMGMIADGSPSATSLILEAGYRGGSLTYSGTGYDWGGYVVRAGVSFSM